MRKSKEERIIEQSEDTLKELHKVYIEGIGVEEYHKLLKEYKKLFKRYEKTIKLSDSMGSGIMGENEVLNDNLNYTIKTARAKLMENVTKHRKTKEAYSIHLSSIRDLKSELEESYLRNEKLEKKLNSFIKIYGDIKNNFEDFTSSDAEIKPLARNINPKEFQDLSIENIVALEKDTSKLILSKIALNNFDSMIESIEKTTSVNNFIFGIYKYIKNSLFRDSVIFHLRKNQFYIITRNKTINDVETSIKNLSKKRNILDFEITFSAGITKFIEEETFSDFVKRCDFIFNEAIKKPHNIVIN